MAVARTQTFDQRGAILDGLLRRNRVIGVLRLAVPLVGIGAFVLLVGQIWLASMTQQYGVSGIRIDRGNLVVETPQYSGMGTDGSRYVVKAREARTPLGVSGRIDMIDATLDYTRPGHSAFHVRGAAASIDTARQYVSVPGVARLNSDDGMHGTLTEVRSDLKAEITRAEGPIDITFPDGTHLEAADLLYEGKLAYWTFNRSTVTIPNLPRTAVPRIPFFTSAWVIQ